MPCEFRKRLLINSSSQRIVVPSGNKTCGIDDLPPELLSEVVAHLDFKDILSLQQVREKYILREDHRLYNQ